MVGLIIILIISWLLLWILERKNLSVLGLAPTKNRLGNLCVGFFMAGLLCAVYHYIKVAAVHNFWMLNPKLSGANLINSTWWIIKSVLFEELLFRGALLYIMIKKLGSRWGCLLSAGAFGVYHWFSYGVFGNPIQMLMILLMTGLFGWVLAKAYDVTKSLYLPIAFHLGWNVVNILVFSNGPLGAQLLVTANDNQAQGLVSLLIFLFQMLALPIFGYLYIRKYGHTWS
ncbi:CPBP family intramembrane glutamic endopeptidase [Sphingobacterium sp. BIGb0165]|uniref:CPBP family intramembrane glutamic endopeptidase n=1 Tax=Sphingobacterium sp. BIGb0165 TaxID=2940615 RepID=UPI002168BA01|nr:CPBP family intramembrane glutamic endopeptidase [Sphingobacterium sp. BIGb0165]MCS4225456.1 membrane protease YdiL (CAAX protease family) [Sphingobacterium sp. BIGb0165]